MSRRILLVDDEADIREVGKMSLEAVAGWQVLTAESGERALEVAAEEQPDAILLDVMMPGMDGPTTVGRLRANERTRELPVILLTAKVQAAEVRGFEGLGVDGVLAKPFDPMTLHEGIAGALGW